MSLPNPTVRGLSFALIAATACSTTAEDPAELFTVTGSGRPAVVFESGLGDSRLSWSAIYLPLATDSAVFAYDRPGLHRGIRNGFFDGTDADGVRTGEEAVHHLRGLLAAARLSPPYVLVGHSLGGQYILMYAKLFPNEIAGIVLVDGRPPNFAIACQEVFPNPGNCIPTDEQLEQLSPPIRAEVTGMLDTERRLPRAEELPDVPITIITSTEPASPPDDPELQRVWMREQQAYAESGRNIRYVEASGAGHYVHSEQPELVIDEVRAVLDAARANGLDN